MENFAEFGKAELKGWSEPQTANAYAEGFASAAEQCVADIVETSLVTNGSVALDVCCGQGIVAKGLATAGAEVIGLDFSPAMLKIARREVPMVDFVEGDATTLPFADNIRCTIKSHDQIMNDLVFGLQFRHNLSKPASACCL
ncbi:methyltransferase domain-containing protein [Ruegeria arenilitoris]|uniref:methyltransferase domain-containing protein n=1 Tax=Ruegeria arenilitoris TaxID=1173585 RepID=UPI001480E551|nr:methyltransferase domain-containing protein [Ruegeria arenilitoris]